MAAEADDELWWRWYAEDELDDWVGELEELDDDELSVEPVVSGTPGIAAEGSACGWVAVVAWPLPLLAVPVLLAAGADELAEPKSAGTPGMATLAAGEAELDPDEPDAPVLADEPDARAEPAPAEPDDPDEADEAAETPGMAAIASVTWVAACDVACVPAALCCLAAEDADRLAADDEPEEDDFAADPLLVAVVVAAGRLPLSTKPCTPSAASEPEYSCALTEKLGSESPPIVDSTPPE